MRPGTFITKVIFICQSIKTSVLIKYQLLPVYFLLGYCDIMDREPHEAFTRQQQPQPQPPQGRQQQGDARRAEPAADDNVDFELSSSDDDDDEYYVELDDELELSSSDDDE